MSSITSDNFIKIDKTEFQKIIFINNVINDGWTVKKCDKSYIFTKKHETIKHEVLCFCTCDWIGKLYTKR